MTLLPSLGGDFRCSKIFPIIHGGVEGGRNQGIAPCKMTRTHARSRDEGGRSHGEDLAGETREPMDQDGAGQGGDSGPGAQALLQ